MIKLIVFIFSLIAAQSLYNGQINFNYSGTESGSFNSLLEDSTNTGLLINQEDPSIIIASFTEHGDNNYDIPGSGDESNPLSLESLTLFIPNVDSNFVIQLLNIINDSTITGDSISIEEYLESVFLEFSDDLYIGLSGEISFNSVTDSSITGNVNIVMLKPVFHFPPHTITIEDGYINFSSVVLPTLDIKKSLYQSNSYKLFDSYPNPFNPETNIHFFAKNKNISLLIYNINGNLIESVISNFNASGYHSFKWNANQHPSGIYFLKLISKSSVQTQKVMFIK